MVEILVKKPIESYNIGWLTLGQNQSKKQRGMHLEVQASMMAIVPNAFDKRHDLSVNASYQLNNNGVLMPISYQTGQPTTYPAGQYELEDLSPIMASEITSVCRLPSNGYISNTKKTPKKNRQGS